MKRMALFIAAVVLAGCSGDRKQETAEAASPPPVTVSVVEARSADWQGFHEAAGTVRAVVSSTLSSKVMGYVREVRVNPGDRVAAGQTLVVLDSRDLESAVLQARAAEQEARSGVAEADNAIAAGEAQLTLAKTTFQRMNDLFMKKSISHQEFDEAQARLRTAEANHRMALSRRSQLDAKIAQAKQAVSSAAIVQSYSEIRAPFGGVVTEKRIEAGQMATPGTPLVVVEQAGGFRIEAPVEESMIGRVRLGQTVSVLLDAQNVSVTGRVTEIVPSVDPSSRAFLVKASIPATPGVRSGSFARMRIPLAAREALVVPADSIRRRGEIEYVFAADGGHARLRMISAGERRDGQAEILSGLRAGERIVHPAPANLADGGRIEVRK